MIDLGTPGTYNMWVSQSIYNDISGVVPFRFYSKCLLAPAPERPPLPSPPLPSPPLPSPPLLSSPLLLLTWLTVQETITSIPNNTVKAGLNFNVKGVGFQNIPTLACRIVMTANSISKSEMREQEGASSRLY